MPKSNIYTAVVKVKLGVVFNNRLGVSMAKIRRAGRHPPVCPTPLLNASGEIHFLRCDSGHIRECQSRLTIAPGASSMAARRAII